MTTHDIAAGQILIGGIEGTSLSAETSRRITKGTLGGVILMGRNIQSPSQVHSLLNEIHEAASPEYPPLLTGVDQEGGRVARLKPPVLSVPSARRLGETGDAELTQRVMAELGRQLRALGFTVDFAPVLDVDGGASRSVIGDRSFSGEPGVVSAHGVAALRGLLAAGICPVGKHFPGHGATVRDSHLELPRVQRSLEELEACEILPFAAAIDAGLPLLMPAHVVFESLDSRYPATFSRAILDDFLRQRLGYLGAIVTDDLMMGAVTQAGGPVDVAIQALMAGADLLLVCHQEELQEELRDAVADAARRSHAVAKRLYSACSRASDLRSRFKPRPAPVGAIDALFSSADARAVSCELEGRIGQFE